MKRTLKLGTEIEILDASTGEALQTWSNGTQAIDHFCSEYGILLETFWSTFDNDFGSRASAKIMLPWFVKEITPDSRRPQVYRFGLESSDFSGNVRALVEAQALSVLAHVAEPLDTLDVEVGDERTPLSWLQLWSDILGATLHGAANGEKQAFHPNLLLHQRYLDLKEVYLACEHHVLSNGPSPDRLRSSFEKRWASLKNS